MFHLIKKQKIEKTFPTFQEAFNFKNNCDYIQDEKGYKYFSDGTGDGFRALKESNSFWGGSHTGIYNQKKLSIHCLIANARWIYWLFGLDESLSYLKRVRTNTQQKTLKLVA